MLFSFFTVGRLQAVQKSTSSNRCLIALVTMKDLFAIIRFVLVTLSLLGSILFTSSNLTPFQPSFTPSPPFLPSHPFIQTTSIPHQNRHELSSTSLTTEKPSPENGTRSSPTRSPTFIPLPALDKHHAHLSNGTSLTYWVKAGAKGTGRQESSPAGNITYLFTQYQLADAVIKVQPGVYNDSIETFPLRLPANNLTVTSVTGPAHTVINGTNATSAFYLTKRENLTITGFTITGARHGIRLYDTRNCTITHTVLHHNHNGILLQGPTSHHTIAYNQLHHNTYQLVCEGSANQIYANTVTQGDHGIKLGGDNNQLTQNILSDNGVYGISLAGVGNNITENNITNHQEGIHLRGDTLIKHNYILNNEEGIHMEHNYNRVVNNRIQGNLYGIFVSFGRDNYVYRNDFVDNRFHAWARLGSINFNTSTIGNYWDTYAGHDQDGDGIGDTPYTISGPGRCKDYRPVIASFFQAVTIVTPREGATIRWPRVQMAWTVDPGVMVDHYLVRKDRSAWQRIGNRTSYQFAWVWGGTHRFAVKLVMVNGSTTRDTVEVQVNLSPLWGPGWWEELAVVGGIIMIVGLVLYVRKKRKEALQRERERVGHTTGQ